jgi:hypothetical protein
MPSRLAAIAHVVLTHPAVPLGRPPVRRNLGTDDWQGSVRSSRADLLRPLPRARGASPAQGHAT